MSILCEAYLPFLSSPLVIPMQHDQQKWHVLIFALRLGLPLVLLFTVIGVGSAGYLKRQQQNAIRDTESDQLASFSQLISAQLTSVCSDVQFIAAEVESYAANGELNDSDLEQLTEQLGRFGQFHPDYYQLRFLDSSGLEVIRINQDRDGKQTIVSPEKLQNKADRSYVKAILKFKEGIYISPMELNIEHDQIVTPFEPVFRVGTMVTVEERSIGMVIFNVWAETILNSLQRMSAEHTSQPLLFDDDGYWMLAPTETLAWGRTLKGRQQCTVANFSPEIWPHVQGSEPQAHVSSLGLMTSNPIAIRGILPPVSEAQNPEATKPSNGQKHSIMAETTWILASLVPMKEWTPHWWRSAKWAYVLGLCLIGWLSWIWAQNRCLRQVMEAERLEHERRLQAICDMSSNITLLLDTHGTIMFANHAIYYYSHMEEEEVVGYSWRVLPWTDSSKDRLDRAFRRLPVDRKWQGELELIVDDTTISLAIALHGPIEGFGPSSILLDGHDISLRKSKEKALAYSRDEFARAFHHAPIGMAIRALEGNWLNVNDSLCNMFGYSQEEMTSQSFKDITHPDDVKLNRKSFQVLNREKDNCQLEKRYITKNGEVVWALLSVSLVRYSNDEPRYFICQILDITENKKLTEQLVEVNNNLYAANAELADKEAFTRAWLNECTDGLWDWNLDTGIEYLSPKLKELLGYASHELRNTRDTWEKLVFPEDLIAAEKAFERHTQQGEPYCIPIRFRHKDGSTVWVICRGVAFKGSDGHYHRMVGTHTDITEMKRLELALSRSNQELEQFAYIASHDLQEPLRMVSSFLGMLEEEYGDVLNEDGRMYISYAVDGASRMQTMIRSLLAYSRVNNNSFAAEMVELQKVMELAIRDLELTIHSRHAAVSLEGLRDIKVYGDAGLLGQLFLNLIGNAIKFTPKDRQPQVQISATMHEFHIRIAIEDNGIGIDPSFQDSVFQVFKRLNRRVDYEGTGIGLALCKRVVNLHEGKIWFESTSGKGTVFFVELPMKATEKQHESH